MGTLRLILALSVVMTHGLTTFGGVSLLNATGAVWVFFAISGFLITVALHLKYSGPGRLSGFYRNRMLRLLPTYWLWLVLTVACYSLLPDAFLTYQRFVVDGSRNTVRFWAEHAEQASSGTILFAAIANATGLFADAFLYLSFDKATGLLQTNSTQTAPVWAMGFLTIGQYWSIGVELCFYALAPWVVRRRWLVMLLFAASISGLLPAAWHFVTRGLPPAFDALQAPKYLWMFMVGSMGAHAWLAWRDQRSPLWPSLLLAGMYVLIAVRAQALFTIPQFPWWLFALLTAAVPVLFQITRNQRFDRFLGDLSYPVYVNHFLLIQLLGSVTAPNGLVFASASVLAAAATVVFLEWRVARLKASTVLPAAPIPAITETAQSLPSQ